MSRTSFSRRRGLLQTFLPLIIFSAAGICQESAVERCEALGTRGPEFESLAKVCRFALASPQTLPNFVCTEHIQRYLRPNRKPDLVEAELTIARMKSHYAYVSVNGKPKQHPVESQDTVFQEEAVSTGEFAMLFNVFDPISRAEFSPPVEERRGQSRWQRYDFRVRRENNVGWTWFFLNGSWRPGYHGSVFVEFATGKVVRLRVQASGNEIEAQTPVSEQTTTIDYADVSIRDVGTYRLPVRGETVSCIPLLQNCTRYVLGFDNFHKFGATTRIVP